MNKENDIFEEISNGEEMVENATRATSEEVDECLFLLENDLLNIETDDETFSNLSDEFFFDEID